MPHLARPNERRLSHHNDCLAPRQRTCDRLSSGRSHRCTSPGVVGCDDAENTIGGTTNFVSAHTPTNDRWELLSGPRTLRINTTRSEATVAALPVLRFSISVTRSRAGLVPASTSDRAGAETISESSPLNVVQQLARVYRPRRAVRSQLARKRARVQSRGARASDVRAPGIS
jgi:hypothetical protein